MLPVARNTIHTRQYFACNHVARNMLPYVGLKVHESIYVFKKQKELDMI